MAVLRFLLGVVVLALGLAPATAHAGHVGCGDVITQDTKLDSDLVDCPGDGVVIGASGITLDLDGHTIDGTGVGDGQQGVDDSAGHDDATVTGGTIREFYDGVYLQDAADAVVRKVGVSATGNAVHVANSDGTKVHQNTLLLSGNGVFVSAGSAQTVIETNRMEGNSGGIFLFGCPLSDTNCPGRLSGTRVARNDLSDNGAGLVQLLALESAIVGNVVSRNTELGIADGNGDALIEGNTVSGNGLGIYISGSVDRVLRNRVTGNQTDGIFVAGFTSDTLLEGNVASGNGDDGIDVDDRTVPSEGSVGTITRNTANDNGDYGIEAAAGVIDGGGNKARGNGNPAQCLNVVCR